MDTFHWDSYFETGIKQVDEQHRVLVDLLNQFGAQIVADDGNPTVLVAAGKELISYTTYHFREEEQLMQCVGVDEEYQRLHGASHRTFVAELLRLMGGAEPEKPKSYEPLFRFLVSWLAYHILGQDQEMARQIAAIGAGESAARAAQGSHVVRDAGTEALLRALHGLFDQMSERNRALDEANALLEARVVERTRALTEANRRLEDMAMTDVLTGLPNRRHGMRAFEALAREGTELDRPISCLLIDADGFKKVNDTHGHDAGDRVLCAVARALRHSVRTDDVVCRLGGDEFMVLCPNTPLAGALVVGEQLRSAVESLRAEPGDGRWVASVSVGVASTSAGRVIPEALMKAADDGVYLAKRDGRNCVRTAQSAGTSVGCAPAHFAALTCAAARPSPAAASRAGEGLCILRAT